MKLPGGDFLHEEANENFPVYTFQGYYIFRRKDGIIQIQFEKGFEGELDDAKRMVNHFALLSEGRKVKILCLYAENNLFSKEVREFIAGPEVNEIVMADALVIKGMAQKIVGNFYLQVNKPSRPTRLFTDKAEALLWLKTL